MARWSPRVRIPILGRFLTLNWGRRGASLSGRLGPLTFNSRGGWSFNGPGILDFRGRWKDAPIRRRRGKAESPRSGQRSFPCGARWRGGAPCPLREGHLDEGWPHRPEGEVAWRPAWTGRPRRFEMYDGTWTR